MSYSGITVHDKNPIKRYLQRRRLRDALSPLGALGERFAGRFLDFGAGNGELTKAIAQRFPRAKVFCYEPAPDLLEEARQNLSGLDNVVLVSSLEELKGLTFRYVFCLEVFEHLPSRETVRAIRAIKRLLANRGIAVVGVPNELFLPALLKGLFRMKGRYGAYDARFGNVFRAAIGRPPDKRPVREIAHGLRLPQAAARALRDLRDRTTVREPRGERVVELGDLPGPQKAQQGLAVGRVQPRLTFRLASLRALRAPSPRVRVARGGCRG